MKLAEYQQKIKTNMDGAKSLDFNIGDPGIIIEILRNKLYGNKIQTIVQEYISNGRDAQREFKSAKPIDVTFPTKSDLVFKVRDYGGGVTPERMQDVFVLYGVSTKRDTNSQLGGYGIGAKSAFAYSDSFTVITFIDGTKRIYIAHLGAKNTGSMDLISETETTEENGTEIQIAVKPHDIRAFGNAIVRAVSFWKDEEYPKLHNAEEWSEKLADARKIGTTRFMDTNLSGIHNEFASDSTSIIIDGIVYDMPNINISEHNQLMSLGGSYNLNVFIPNGLVSVAASREKIDDSDANKNALKQIFKAALADYKKALDDWEAEISDTASLLKAKERSGGFVLSTKKSYDNVVLYKGNFNLETERFVDNDAYDSNDKEDKKRLLEKLFTTNQVLDYKDRYSEKFDVYGENRYYLVKPGKIKIENIRSWIRQHKNIKVKNPVTGEEKVIGQINLITIVASRMTKQVFKNKATGVDDVVWKNMRQPELETELVASVERLGFRNIEEIIPVPAKVKNSAPKQPKPVDKIMRIISMRDDVPTEISSLPVKSDQKKPWLYVVCKKSDHEYERFTDIVKHFRKLGLIEDGYRVLEKNKKLIESDDRFTKYEDFLNAWVPDVRMVLDYGFGNWNRDHYWRNNNFHLETFLFNIKNHFKDKNHVMYKSAACIIGRDNYSLTYELSKKVEDDPRIKEVKDGLEKFEEFAKKYFPFLDSSFSDSADSDHINEYIKWGLDRAAKDGVVLILPDIIVNTK